MTFFKVENLTKRFSGVLALDGVSFDVEQGEIVGLIGPNGAGKSTCFNVITGTLPATEGHVTFRGHAITNMSPHQIAKLGIVRSFQQTSVFQHLTVRDNIKTSCHLQSRATGLDALLRNSRHHRNEAAIEEEADRILELVDLKAVADVVAINLPFGSLRKLGVAIGLAARPSFLLLDEPAAGLNPIESAELSELLRRLRDGGLTILIVEHDMKVIMRLCDRLIVLNYGKKLAQGSPAEIRANPEVVASYLGRRHAEG